MKNLVYAIEYASDTLVLEHRTSESKDSPSEGNFCISAVIQIPLLWRGVA